MTRCLLLSIAVVFVASSLHAQGGGLRSEVRVDALGPKPYSVEPGVGVIVPMGHYARVGASVGYAVPLDTGFVGTRWRADLVARLTLDPFREQRWAFSLGGGLSYRRRNAYLAAIADIEGPEMRGWLPAFQIGVSGGVRAAAILRRAVPGRR